MALQNTGEAVFHLGSGCAHRQRAGDVGGAVQILRARINQENAARNFAVGGLGYTVMRDGGIGAKTRNRGKRHIPELARIAPETLQRLDSGYFTLLAFGGICIKPAQEFGQRHRIAQVGLAGASQFAAVFGGFHQGNRIRAALR